MCSVYISGENNREVCYKYRINSFEKLINNAPNFTDLSLILKKLFFDFFHRSGSISPQNIVLLFLSCFLLIKKFQLFVMSNAVQIVSKFYNNFPVIFYIFR